MPLQIRRPIEIELDPEPREREDRKQRTRLAEEMKKNFKRMVEERSQRNRQLLREQRLRERAAEPPSGPLRELAEAFAPPGGPFREEERIQRGGEGAREFFESIRNLPLPAVAQVQGLADVARQRRTTPQELVARPGESGFEREALRQSVQTAAIPRLEQLVPAPGLRRTAAALASPVTGTLALEQKFIARRTQPVIQGALESVGVPTSVAAPVATIGSQIALPTSLVPFVGQGSKAIRVARALTAGAALSVAQEDAFIREFEGRDPELWELLLAAGAGGGGAGVIESGAIGAGIRRLRPGRVAGEVAEEVAPAVARQEPPPGRFDVPTEEITPETGIPPGVSRVSPIQGQQLAELPAGQLELPFPRTRNAQEIAGLAGERRINAAAVREGALTGANTVDDVLAAEAGVAAARQADNVARVADLEDLTKTSFDDLVAEARRVCRG